MEIVAKMRFFDKTGHLSLKTASYNVRLGFKITVHAWRSADRYITFSIWTRIAWHKSVRSDMSCHFVEKNTNKLSTSLCLKWQESDSSYNMPQNTDNFSNFMSDKSIIVGYWSHLMIVLVSDVYFRASLWSGTLVFNDSSSFKCLFQSKSLIGDTSI
jgi:hypothetical protein